MHMKNNTNTYIHINKLTTKIGVYNNKLEDFQNPRNICTILMLF